MLMVAYSALLTVLLFATSPVWGWRMLRQGRYRTGLRERLGSVPRRLVDFAAGRPVLWLHAVSVGELLAATRLVGELESAFPGHALVISTTTPTGQAVARERFGADRVFYYPLDFAFAVTPYLQALQPAAVLLMESELWPRMLHECGRLAVPVAVLNARVSDRSLPRYLRLKVLWKPLLRRVSLLLAQSQEDASRWTRVGMLPDRVQVPGNLKYDVRVATDTPLTAALRKHLSPAAQVLVCGSTHSGEEEVLLDCWKSLPSGNRVMLLAPRHPERAGAVLDMALARGLHTQPISEWRMNTAAVKDSSVLLLDTVGELAPLYGLARVAFVGGSLIPHGGQNPLEPAQFGVPVLMGPSYENFRDVVASMAENRAITIVDPATLCAAISTALATSPTADDSDNCKKIFATHSGSTGRTVLALQTLLAAHASATGGDE